jgi:transposase
MLQPLVRRTWAPMGKTPILRSWVRRGRLSVISALSISPVRRICGLYFRIHEENIRTENVCAFLVHVRRHLRRDLIVVCDRLNAHRSAMCQLKKRFRTAFDVEWLPAYAPQLNPVEGVWSHTKYGSLSNFIPQDMDELRRNVIKAFGHIRSRSKLYSSFFRHAKLSL